MLAPFGNCKKGHLNFALCCCCFSSCEQNLLNCALNIHTTFWRPWHNFKDIEYRELDFLFLFFAQKVISNQDPNLCSSDICLQTYSKEKKKRKFAPVLYGGSFNLPVFGLSQNFFKVEGGGGRGGEGRVFKWDLWNYMVITSDELYILYQFRWPWSSFKVTVVLKRWNRKLDFFLFRFWWLLWPWFL